MTTRNPMSSDSRSLRKLKRLEALMYVGSLLIHDPPQHTRKVRRPACQDSYHSATLPPNSS